MASFVSVKAVIKCRVCKKEILKKNYKPHLVKAHPNENPDDLMPYGQNRIAELFPRYKKTDEQTASVP